MKILAIETSCDETATAIIEGDKLPRVASNVVASQIDIHKEFGGVVPEVAARAHIEAIIPMIKKALKGTSPSEIDYLAVTYGPGLIGSLIVGVETAKALSLAWNKPLIPLNHLEGHLYANFIRDDSKLKIQNSKFVEPKFPLIALLVSGGHTLIILMRDHLSYEVIGKTRDDAAGEAFDKAAKIMGLGYPGGPIIAKLAEKGNENAYEFPVIDLTGAPKRNEQGFLEKQEESLDFSFSGLKTALLNKVKQLTINNKRLTVGQKRDLAASFQKAVIENLSQNVVRAVRKYHPKSFILSGGVAANKKLRETLGTEIKKVSPKTTYLTPNTSFCTDNAVMIGAAAFYHISLQPTNYNLITNLSAEPNLKL